MSEAEESARSEKEKIWGGQVLAKGKTWGKIWRGSGKGGPPREHRGTVRDSGKETIFERFGGQKGGIRA